MTRDDLQDYAAKRLEREKRLIAQWCTGSGKSRILLKFLESHPDFKCLILVPETNNIENWLYEFRKFGMDAGNTSIMCYASFHKQAETRWDIVCFDEMPHVDTEKRLAICDSVSADYILALGAVITEDERNALEYIYGKFEKMVLSLEFAIKNKLLPSPTIKVLHLALDDKYPKFWYKGRQYTAKQRYDYIERKLESAKQTYQLAANKYNLNRMLRLGNERKRFLGELKEDAIRRLCDALSMKKRRFLCFCSSIDQANKIGLDHAFTSETPASMRLLERFNNHEIDSLFVVGKLIEGQNLNDIEVGIIGQLGGTERITVQSIGRIMRSENPLIYVPIFDGTKDNGFLSTLTDNVPKEYIQHFKF